MCGMHYFGLAMIDSHAHLDDGQFNKDRDGVVERAKFLKCVLNPASAFGSNQKILSLAEKYPGFLVPALGLDPVHCLKEKKLAEVSDLIEKNRKSIAAIGEVGLDYYWSKERDAQKGNFSEFLLLAERLTLPVIVHLRDSVEDGLRMLEHAGTQNAILHHFSGSLQEGLRAEKSGHMLSFATNICWEGSWRKLIKALSFTNILAETDSPYVWRGGRNEPAFVKKAYETIADARGAGLDEAERQIDGNFERVFGNGV